MDAPLPPTSSVQSYHTVCTVACENRGGVSPNPSTNSALLPRPSSLECTTAECCSCPTRQSYVQRGSWSQRVPPVTLQAPWLMRSKNEQLLNPISCTLPAALCNQKPYHPKPYGDNFSYPFHKSATNVSTTEVQASTKWTELCGGVRL